jgi:heat shock protein HtpX
MIGALALSIIAPMAAMVIQMAISRSREYLADATGARFAGSSEGLAKALEKLGAYSQRRPMNANAATAHMFIVNPLSGRSMQRFFSTHPPSRTASGVCAGAGPWTVRRPHPRRVPAGDRTPTAATPKAKPSGTGCRANQEYDPVSGRVLDAPQVIAGVTRARFTRSGWT